MIVSVKGASKTVSRPPASDANSTDPHIIWLHEAHPRQLDLIGCKALNLAVALRLKQPVPPGFVVTTAAYAFGLEQLGFQASQLANLSYEEALKTARTIQHYFFKQSIPSDVLTDIRSAYKQLVGTGDSRVVIRPSLVYNNSVDFAKRLRPILGVKSLIELEKALKMAWAYMWLDDIIHYRFSRPELSQRWHDLALLIQPLHTPYVSGTLLTYQPEKDEQSFVIEAARGLNEAVSRGVIVPDRYVWQRFLKKVSEREVTKKPLRFVLAEQWAVQEVPIEASQQAQAALTDIDVSALGEMAEALMAGYQRPLEIEWFKTEKGLQILQLIPVDLPKFETVSPEDWQDPNDRFPYFEKPFSPLGWSFLEPVLCQAMQGFEEVLNLPENTLPEPLFRLQDHQLYLHPDISEVLTQLFEQHWAELAELSPYGRGLAFLRWLLPQQRHWSRAYQDYTQAMATDWSQDHSGWGTEQLLQALQELSENVSEFLVHALHVRVLNHLCGVFFADFAQTFLPADQVYDILFQGLDTRQAETARCLDQYLAQIQQNPEWLRLFKSENPHQIVRLLQLDEAGKQWLKKLRQDFAQSGFYQIGLEPLYPTWVEAPQVLVHELKEALIHERHFSETHLKAQREALEQELTESFSWIELRQRFFFTSLLHLGQNTLTTVQDEPYYLAMFIPQLRSLALTMARYLPLDSRQDIFYLTLTEIQEMIQNPMNAYKIKELRELIQARKYKRRITHRLGPEAAGGLQSLELQGRAASRGEALGRVRLVTRSEDLKLLQPGEIIVTDYFEPFWEQALEKAGGLIMELGGSLAHGSMLARHYKVPAVAAVAQATQKLKNGLIVRLDGNRGHVLAYQEDALEAHEEFVY